MENLYRTIIMEHYKNPQNKGLRNDGNLITVHLDNPSCGDEMTVQFLIDADQIKKIYHDGKGCSICCSSASIMSESLLNKKIAEIKLHLNEFFLMLTGKTFNQSILNGDEVAFQGVASFPARIKCATLAWKAIELGINKFEAGEI